MIPEPIDTTKVRLRDLVRRRERNLPVLDDEADLLQRALLLIEELESALQEAEEDY